MGRADHFIELKRKYPALYKGYEWSLKEFGFLFCLEEMRKGATRSAMEFGCGYNTSFSDAMVQSQIGLTLLDDPMSGKGIAGDEARIQSTIDAVQKNGHSYVRGQLGSTSIPDGSFDVIFSVSVVEHIDDATMEICTNDAFRLLRPGGRLINSIDVYPRSTRHKMWHHYCLKSGFKVPAPHDLTWNWDGDNVTLIERPDIRYKVYNSITTADAMRKNIKYSSHFATTLHVAHKS